MAAEQKARKTYDNILTLVKESDVREPIKFLRAREIVHFQRFGEALRMVTVTWTKRTSMLSIQALYKIGYRITDYKYILSFTN